MQVVSAYATAVDRSKVPKLLLYTPPLLASRTHTATCQAPGVLPAVLQVSVLVVEKAWPTAQRPAPGAGGRTWKTGWAPGQGREAVNVGDDPTLVIPGGAPAGVSPVQVGATSVYGMKLTASHRPKLLPKSPALIASLAQTATWYPPTMLPVVCHVKVLVVE